MEPELKSVTVQSHGEAVMNTSEEWAYLDAMREAKTAAAKQACGTGVADVYFLTIKSANLFKDGNKFHATIVADVQCRQVEKKGASIFQNSNIYTSVLLRTPDNCHSGPRFEKPLCRKSDNQNSRNSTRSNKL